MPRRKKRRMPFAGIVALTLCVALTALLTNRQRFAASLFSDVPDAHRHAAAINSLRAQGVLNGYPDGTFRPDARITRGELLTVVARSSVPLAKLQECADKFHAQYGQWAKFLHDVPPGAYFEGPVCWAIATKVIKGYDDKTFRPNQETTVAEAMKIAALAFKLRVLPESDDEEWYLSYVEALNEKRALPPDIGEPSTPILRGVLAAMLYRLRGGESAAPVAPLPQSSSALHQGPPAEAQPSSTVSAQLINAINAERGKKNLEPFTWNEKLEESATLHAQDMNKFGYYSHRSPDGRTVERRIRDVGYLDIDRATCNCKNWSYRYGEAIMAGDKTVGDVMQSFLTSKVHRDIILSPTFTEIGVGNMGEYWVLNLGAIVYER